MGNINRPNSTIQITGGRGADGTPLHIPQDNEFSVYVWELLITANVALAANADGFVGYNRLEKAAQTLEKSIDREGQYND